MAYDANSIKVRDFRTACRVSPGMYLGADGQDATFNCFLEILNNACDEAIMGRGDRIEIVIDDDSLSCTDHGAGIPYGPNNDCEEVLIELFTTSHSSGKFDQENYRKVRGLHGVGSSAVCVCSDKFEVWSRRGGAEHYLLFRDGIPQSQVSLKTKETDATGTTIKFTPSREVFHIAADQPLFDIERIRNELELTSYFIPKVSFSLVSPAGEYTYRSENGLRDFAISRIKKPLHDSPLYAAKTFPGDIDIEIFAQWTAGKEKCYIFSNGALNSGGGTPEPGMKAAFTRTLNSLGGTNFDGDLIRRGLVTIINIHHPSPIYQNQVKDKIQNAELRGFTQTIFTDAIKEWARQHNDEFLKIVGILKKETKAEEAAERARLAVLTQERRETEQKSKKIIMPTKFRDCEKHGMDSMLIVCEGN